MRRIMLSTGPAALFGAMLAAALLVFLPLRAALGWATMGEHGLVARSVDGTIWSGTLHEATIGTLPLGDVDARLAPLSLLLGQARIVLAGAGGSDGVGGGATLPLSGSAFVSRHGLGLDDVTAHVPTGRTFAPLPVTALDLDGFSVRFEDGRCVAAAGRVRATLAGEVGGIALPPSAEGVARCDAGDLLLPLASQAGTEAIALHLGGDGDYRADLLVRPADPAAGERLTAAGFTGGSDGYRVSVEGRLRQP